MFEPTAIVAATRSPLFVAHLLAIVVSVALAAYAVRHDEYAGARYFALWLGANTVWIGFRTLGLVAFDPDVRLVTDSLSLAAVPVAATGWLLFALAYSGRWQPERTPFTVALVGCSGALVVVLATNPLHGFVFGNVAVESWRGVAGMAGFSPRTGFWLFYIYIYALYLAGVAVVFNLILSSNHLYHDQSIALVVSVTLPLVVAALYPTGALPVPVDPTPLTFGAVSVPLAYSVFRSELLQFVPAAFQRGEQRAIETLDQGVLVLDVEDRVVFANASVAEIVAADPQTLAGQSVETVLADSPLQPAPDWAGDQRTEADSADRTAETAADDPGLRSGDADSGGLVADLRPSTDGTGAREAVQSAGSLRRPPDGPERPVGDGSGVPRAMEHAGSGRTYEVMESRIDDPGGPELGRTLFFRDVTEERRRKQRLLVLNRVVRHNLRNDMNVLRGHVRLLADESDEDSVAVIEDIASELIQLGEKAHQMDRIVQEADEAESPVNVAGIVDRVVQRHEGDADVPIEVRGPAQAWTTSRGPIVEAIVSNLVENAVEHTPADPAADDASAPVDSTADDATASVDSTADDATAPVDSTADDATASVDSTTDDATASVDSTADDASTPAPSVTVEVAVDDGAVTLVVDDDGPGIPDQEIATLVRGEVSALQHGSGIGLWMVKWCVDLANASWDVDTDDGTRVTVSSRRSPVGRPIDRPADRMGPSTDAAPRRRRRSDSSPTSSITGATVVRQPEEHRYRRYRRPERVQIATVILPVGRTVH